MAIKNKALKIFMNDNQRLEYGTCFVGLVRSENGGGQVITRQKRYLSVLKDTKEYALKHGFRKITIHDSRKEKNYDYNLGKR